MSFVTIFWDVILGWKFIMIFNWERKTFHNILSDCHYSDVINSLLNAFRLKKSYVVRTWQFKKTSKKSLLFNKYLIWNSNKLSHEQSRNRNMYSTAGILKNYREKRTTNEFKYAITKSIFPRNNDEGDQAQRYYSKVSLPTSG